MLQHRKAGTGGTEFSWSAGTLLRLAPTTQSESCWKNRKLVFHNGKQTKQAQVGLLGPCQPQKRWHELPLACGHQLPTSVTLCPEGSAHPSGPPEHSQTPSPPLTMFTRSQEDAQCLWHTLPAEAGPPSLGSCPAWPGSRGRPSSHYCRSLAGLEEASPYHFPTLTPKELHHSAPVCWPRSR